MQKNQVKKEKKKSFGQLYQQIAALTSIDTVSLRGHKLKVLGTAALSKSNRN